MSEILASFCMVILHYSVIIQSASKQYLMTTSVRNLYQLLPSLHSVLGDNSVNQQAVPDDFSLPSVL